jgi:hypothetical protein
MNNVACKGFMMDLFSRALESGSLREKVSRREPGYAQQTKLDLLGAYGVSCRLGRVEDLPGLRVVHPSSGNWRTLADRRSR